MCVVVVVFVFFLQNVLSEGIFSHFKDLLKLHSRGRISDTSNRIKAAFPFV